MSDPLDFLDADASEAETVTSAAPASAAPARDDQGRFAAPAEEQAAPVEQAAPQTAALPGPTTAPDPETGLTPSGHVPLAALLDTRDKVKQAEARAAEAESRLAAIEAAKQAPQGPPDRYADPDGYDDWFQLQIIDHQRGLETQIQSMRAEAKHGPELVSAAVEWARQRCNENGGRNDFNARMLASANRVEDAVVAYQQEQALSALSDPEQLRAFNEWRAGQSAAPASEQAASAPQPQPLPPRSIVSAIPAAGAAKPGQQPVGAGVAFDAVFPE
jgi:hypothetical protein